MELHDFCHKLRDKVREFERGMREEPVIDEENFEAWFQIFKDWL